MQDYVEIIPLGGLGEFGMNMMAVGYDDRYVLVDCGKMFPDDKHLGVEGVIPDFTWVINNKKKIDALFLTHGHEDHIGAVGHLLREVDIPVFGTPLTLGITRQRLKEIVLPFNPRLHEVSRGDQVSRGPFEVDFISVSHGIPDACAFAINTPAGTVIHTGDFKIDQTPMDNHHFDFQTFAEYGNKGVLLLLSDSTNIERPGYTFSEKEVHEGFQKIFQDATGKIVIASFASHFHRMQQIVDIAAQHNRKVAFLGRSMEQNSRMAQELGYLTIPMGVEISPKEVRNHDDNKVVVIASGTQAEPNSATTKLAMGIHPLLRINKGDTVALSARQIPGNEKPIGNIINLLYQRGAVVYHDGTLDIHVSGHAAREEQKMMINLVKPKNFIPVHGEYRMLVLHARLAERMGIKDNHVEVITSGDIARVSNEGISLAGRVQVGYKYVDNSDIEEVDVEAMDDRRTLAQEGVVVPIVVVEVYQGTPQVVSIKFLTKALSNHDMAQEVVDNAEDLIVDLVEECSEDQIRDDEHMKKLIGKTIRKYLLKAINVRPMILPVILEVEESE
jgi:ribonuclease J